MSCKYIVVGSVTYAMKSKEILDAYGIYNKIEKIKKVKALNGCGFAVRVNSDEVGYAMRYINLSGIKIADVLDCEEKTR